MNYKIIVNSFKCSNIELCKIYIFMLIAMISACNSDLNNLPKDETCVELQIDKEFTVDNKYQMVYLGNIKDFQDSSNCFRLNDWINQELHYFEKKEEFLDTLYALEDVPDTNDEDFNNKEYIRLFRYNFAFGNGNIEIMDCINEGKFWNIVCYDVEFNRNCNVPMVSFPNGIDFSSSCFSITDRSKFQLGIEQIEPVRLAMFETDFLNIAYFDTGEINICDGYDIQIIYDGNSSMIDSKREFYRSCPGERSPIGIISDEILNLKNSHNT